MTLLKIEVKTVTGKYHPEDMVKIWAPALRANGDMVVSTAPEIIKLVQGQAEVELIPGPARVQIMCGGTLDNAVRKVTIPDATTATLRTVLEEGFDWEPEIVTEVMRYRNDAVAAATSAAEEAADAANSAMNAATSAGEAATSATDAATSAGGAATSATDAATSAGEAATSATNAATSAGEAATHGDASLDAAAAAIAAAVSVAQFQGHGFPEGVVTAPVGSIYTDLDATNGAIRWIKTSGTGNTGWQVEYGDTGWRDVSFLLTYGWNGSVRIRRVGSTTHLSINGLPGIDRSALPIPIGFRGRTDHAIPVPLVIGNSTIGYALVTEGTYVIADIATEPGSERSLYVAYHTPDPWPSILPDIPQ